MLQPAYQPTRHLDPFRARPDLLSILNEDILLPAEQMAMANAHVGQYSWERTVDGYLKQQANAKVILPRLQFEHIRIANRNLSAYIVPSSICPEPTMLLLCHGVREDGGIKVAKRGKETRIRVHQHNAMFSEIQGSLFGQKSRAGLYRHCFLISDIKTRDHLRTYLTFPIRIENAGTLLVCEDVLCLYDGTIFAAKKKVNRRQAENIDVIIKKKNTG